MLRTCVRTVYIRTVVTRVKYTDVIMHIIGTSSLLTVGRIACSLNRIEWKHWVACYCACCCAAFLFQNHIGWDIAVLVDVATLLFRCCCRCRCCCLPPLRLPAVSAITHTLSIDKHVNK